MTAEYDGEHRPQISFKETNGWVKFLLSSGPVAWLLLGFGIIAWGLKLEARIDSKELRISHIEAEQAAITKDHNMLLQTVTRMDERQQGVIKRLDGK
jgi:hypothetical protein